MAVINIIIPHFMHMEAKLSQIHNVPKVTWLGSLDYKSASSRVYVLQYSVLPVNGLVDCTGPNSRLPHLHCVHYKYSDILFVGTQQVPSESQCFSVFFILKFLLNDIQ